MEKKEALATIKRWEAIVIDYSKDVKELKSQIKKEYEVAMEYLNNRYGGV